MSQIHPDAALQFWSNITVEWAHHEETNQALHERIARERLDETVWKSEFDQDIQTVVQIASKVSARLKQAKSDDLLWIKEGWSCDDPGRRSLTWLIWGHGVELPDDLIVPMLQQGLKDPSTLEFVFVDAVRRVRGERFVLDWLAPFLYDDNVQYSIRSAWAIVSVVGAYTAGDWKNHIEDEEMKWEIKEKFLRRFLSDPPTELALSLIHLIPLVVDDCPLALHEIVNQANQVAARHPDANVRGFYKIRFAEQIKAKRSW